MAAGIDKKQDFALSTMFAMRSLYALRQRQGEALETYYRRFQAAINTAEMLEATVADHVGIVNASKSTEETEDEEEEIVRACKEKYKAILFLMSADHKLYSKLWARLAESTTLGRNEYPKTMASAFEILAKCKPKENHAQANQNVDDYKVSTAGTTFTQVKKENTTQTDKPPVPGANGMLLPSHIVCYYCGSPGHIAAQCPEVEKEPKKQVQGFQIGLSQLKQQVVPDTWLLLDTGSTISSINNPRLLYNIHATNNVCRAYTNGGHIDYSQEGELMMFPHRAYFSRKGIANILSMGEIAKQYRITMELDTHQILTCTLILPPP